MPTAGQEPIFHHDPCGDGTHVMAIEYPLPGLSITDEIKSILDPWLLQFVGLEGSAAHAVLTRHWENIGDSCLFSLRDYLLQFTASSIILHENEGWLVMTDPTLPNAKYISSVGDAWFLAPPPDTEILHQRLEAFGLQGIKGLSSFFLYFNGLREYLPGCAGYFFKPNEWQYLASLGWENCQGYDYWRNAVMFWHAQNGDHVLLNPSGEMGWYVLELNKVVHFMDNFPDFVSYFARHHIENRQCFDAWATVLGG